VQQAAKPYVSGNNFSHFGLFHNQRGYGKAPFYSCIPDALNDFEIKLSYESLKYIGGYKT
jgi:hypothetical protein